MDKNIHILPTDKPSRFCFKITDQFQGFDFHPYNERKLNTWYKPQNIYITNDEKIKKGDWYLTFINNEVMGQPRKCEDTNWNFSYCKKIILTTDPYLIADGVQAIPDEFLEWFVKNPTCERVEIKMDWVVCDCSCDTSNCTHNYKIPTIIIPE